MKTLIMVMMLFGVPLAQAYELTDGERLLLKIILKQDMQMDIHTKSIDDVHRDRVTPLELALSDCNSVDELATIMNDEKIDPYQRFNAARGLAYLDDKRGMDILEETLQGNFAVSSSGFEQSKAAICLLFLGYAFPEGFVFSQLPNALFPELDMLVNRLNLPQEYLGTWYFSRSSGGFSGQGNPGYTIDRIEILADNTLKEYRDDELVSCKKFVPRKDKSIFFTEPVWMITFAGEDISRALWFGPEGELNISDNVYDGLQYTYTRTNETEY